VVTVLNSLGPTNMEINNALWRSAMCPNEEQYCIVLGGGDPGLLRDYAARQRQQPVRITVCDGSYTKLRRTLDLILRDLRERAVPVVVQISQTRSAVGALLLNRLPLRGVPTLFTVRSMFRLYNWRTKLLTAIAGMAATRVNFVSAAGVESFPRLLRGLKRGRVHLIVNGIDPAKIDASLAESPPAAVRVDETIRLVNVGRLIPAKHQGWLLDLLARLPEQFVLTVVGDGPLRGELEARAERFGLLGGRVRFTGQVYRAEVFREMAAADVFVSSSVREGMPVAVLEAMAARLPVVLSDIGPHAEIGRGGDSVRVLPHDFGHWEKALAVLGGCSRAERLAIGEQNRRIIDAQFSEARMHRQYTELYEELWRRS
jgi:glycosyltransferase involved in cell wall biosynthesis